MTPEEFKAFVMMYQNPAPLEMVPLIVGALVIAFIAGLVGFSMGFSVCHKIVKGFRP